MDLASARPSSSYLLTGLSIFLSHEPCLLCAMSLLHSRVSAVYYVRRSPGGGGLGSTYNVQEDRGLNHGFEVWEWVGGPSVSEDQQRGEGVGEEEGEGEQGEEGEGFGRGCGVRCDC